MMQENVNTDEEHETQSSGAGSEGKTHISTFHLFFSIILAPKGMISLQHRTRLWWKRTSREQSCPVGLTLV